MYLVVKNKKYLTISDEKGYGLTKSITKAFEFNCLAMAQDKAREVKGYILSVADVDHLTIIEDYSGKIYGGYVTRDNQLRNAILETITPRHEGV